MLNPWVAIVLVPAATASLFVSGMAFDRVVTPSVPPTAPAQTAMIEQLQKLNYTAEKLLDTTTQIRADSLESQKIAARILCTINGAVAGCPAKAAAR